MVYTPSPNLLHTASTYKSWWKDHTVEKLSMEQLHQLQIYIYNLNVAKVVKVELQ